MCIEYFMRTAFIKEKYNRKLETIKTFIFKVLLTFYRNQPLNDNNSVSVASNVAAKFAHSNHFLYSF